MTEEEQKQQAELEAQQKKEQLEAERKSLEGKSTQELLNMIFETRGEARDRRLETKKLQEEIEKFKSKQTKEEEDKMKQQGELQKLLELKEQELASLKPKADEFERLRTSEIEEAKKTLGDKWDEEYSNLSLVALRKMVSVLSAKAADPNLDNGKNDDKPSKQVVSSVES